MATYPSTCISVAAPAKLNLFFELCGRRPDGFHEVETILAAVALWDFLEFRPLPSPELQLEVRCLFPQKSSADRRPASQRTPVPGRSANAAEAANPRQCRPVSVPEPSGFLDTQVAPNADESNLVYRAARLLQEQSGVTEGAAIRLWKRIPIGGGLGGGSADAAATLLAGNLAWGLFWPMERLLPLARQLGSDVAFFLSPTTGLYRGRGDIPVGPVVTGRLHVVLVTPDHGNPTSRVFARVRLPERSRSSSEIIGNPRIGMAAELARGLFNRLAEAAAEENRGVTGALAALARAGVQYPSVSGSGSTCFGLMRHRRHALRVARCLDSRGWNSTAAESVSGFHLRSRGALPRPQGAT